MRVQCIASHLICDEGVTYRKGDVFEIREEDYPRVRTAVKVLPEPVPVETSEPVPVVTPEPAVEQDSTPVATPEPEPVETPAPKKTTEKRGSRAK